MITEERMAVFLDSLSGGTTPFLEELERQAKEDRVPVIRRQTQELLRFLLAVKKPQRILEVGTAVGFSALLMSEYAPEGCRITTIENWEPRICQAKENFRRAGKSGEIVLLEGDAGELLGQLEGPYDFLFLDAAKGQYPSYLPELLRLLCPGGLLVSDNVLQEGDILESRYAVTRRDRTIHARMRSFLHELTHTEGVVTVVLPVGDGVTVSVKQ